MSEQSIGTHGTASGPPATATITVTVPPHGVLDPRPDLTPREALDLALMVQAMAVPGWTPFNAAGWVTVRRLERHFRQGGAP